MAFLSCAHTHTDKYLFCNGIASINAWHKSLSCELFLVFVFILIRTSYKWNFLSFYLCGLNSRYFCVLHNTMKCPSEYISVQMINDKQTSILVSLFLLVRNCICTMIELSNWCDSDSWNTLEWIPKKAHKHCWKNSGFEGGGTEFVIRVAFETNFVSAWSKWMDVENFEGWEVMFLLAAITKPESIVDFQKIEKKIV